MMAVADLQFEVVVAGGRFREPYYWDSFWILEGLLRTGGSFTEISRYAAIVDLV